MLNKPNTELEQTPKSENQEQSTLNWQLWTSWGVTVLLVATLVSILFWQPILAQELNDLGDMPVSIDNIDPMPELSSAGLVNMPYFEIEGNEDPYLMRHPDTSTEGSSQLRRLPIVYEVMQGDAVFSIAQKFEISPETLLWSNFATLRDDPHALSPEQILVIPPTDGILYEWEEGDRLQEVAREFWASADDILMWAGNKLDLTNPEIEPGEMVMIPGGRREFQQWIVPTYAVGRAGVNSNVPDGCSIAGPLLGGSGWFQWPADNRYLSGNDYWSGHLAIDIAAASGAPIYAADSGVVVYAGWDSRGYGNVVMIDHLNGYQTLYAHLSSINVSCGSNVVQGNMVGRGGSTGNSTGPHLHFEVRYMGGFINPWTILP